MTRSAETERQILNLFEAALEQPSDGRKDWVRTQAGDDLDIAQTVLAMLELDAENEVVLRTGAAASDLGTVKHPERINAYKITRVIGEGGMGVVLEGERDRGDFEHRVAIKVIRPGLLSPQLVARFADERKILARLKHPGIAQLFDGGELENGSPYFVMEFIEGIPVTKWIAKNDLKPQDILRLYLGILDAVGYAHQNLIVHRDITPSNVLLTADGQPKLIDFGIAKPQAEWKDFSAATASGSLQSLSFTPGFAAPERELGAPPNILSDIFSLGRLLQSMLAEHKISDDLLKIIEKAAQAEPKQRYESTQALREDVEAFLNGYPVDANPQGWIGQFGYFTKRHPLSSSFATLAVVSVIGGLIVMSSLYAQAEKARQEATRRFDDLHALANTLMFDIYDDIDTLPGATSAKQQLAATAQAYLDSLSQDQRASSKVRLDTALGYKRLAGIQGSPSMESSLSAEDALKSLENAETILTRLLAENRNDEAVRLALGQVYFEQAHIANNPYQKLDEARALLTKSINVLAVPDTKGQLPYERERAMLSSRGLEASVMSWQGETDAAVTAFRDAIDRTRELLAPRPDDQDLNALLGSFLRNLGDILTRQNDYASAEVILKEAVAQAQTILDANPDNTRNHRALAIAHWRYAFALYNLGQSETALQHYETALSIAEDMVLTDPENKDAANVRNMLLGEIILPLVGLKRFDEAEKMGLQSLKIQKSFYDEAPDVARYQRNMMVQYYQLYDLYSKSDDTAKSCNALSELRHYTELMLKGGSLPEADKAELQGLNPQFRKCRVPEL